jgi:electron transfer flavoprotein alpha subunit
VVWVYAELKDGAPRPITLELLSQARKLGDAEAVALGPSASQAVDPMGRYGAKRVYLHEDRAFEDVLAMPAVSLLAGLVERHHPDLLLFGMTYSGRDIAARLSARLGSALVANVTDIERQADGFKAVTPVFGGSTLVTTAPLKKPPIFLVRPKAFVAEAGESRPPQVEKITDPVALDGPVARVVERKVEAAQGPKLEDAEIIVSGGRGLGAPENFKLVEDLAQALGAAVGASRAVVDAGWKPYAMQIGQTGITVKPSVYIACGISGAMQHTVGMKGAKTIIAINKDPEAPIFKLADLGVVGDVHKILPRLTEEIRARRGVRSAAG